MAIFMHIFLGGSMPKFHKASFLRVVLSLWSGSDTCFYEVKDKYADSKQVLVNLKRKGFFVSQKALFYHSISELTNDRVIERVINYLMAWLHGFEILKGKFSSVQFGARQSRCRWFILLGYSTYWSSLA